MTRPEIESYLQQQNLALSIDVLTAIEEYRKDAIKIQDENTANYWWCMRQIYIVQEKYLSFFCKLREHDYEEAWFTLERIDIELSFLEGVFDIGNEYDDKYHLVFIGKIIKHFEALFPYRYFISTETLIKSEECSICGQKVNIRHPCGHEPGKLYMGEFCSRKVTDCKFVGAAIVTDPFDKYSFMKIDGLEYNYKMLDYLMDNLYSAWDVWCVEKLPIEGTNEIHYRVSLLNQPAGEIIPFEYISTFKENADCDI